MSTMPEESGAGSVSKVPMVLKVRGKGDVKLSLYKHLAPLTVNALLRSIPLDSRVSVQPAMISLFTDVRVGVEKPKVSLTRGELAFLASGGLICIFLRSVKSDRPLNPMGSVDSGMDVLDGLRPGDVVNLRTEA